MGRTIFPVRKILIQTNNWISIKIDILGYTINIVGIILVRTFPFKSDDDVGISRL